jgi:methylmalonyl-CoA mutase N-terminal domain/subunit
MKKQHKQQIEETPEQQAQREEQERLRKERHEQNVAFAVEALNAFVKHYPPAKTIDEAARFLTAAEIIHTIKEIYPTASIDDYTLSVFLKTVGYRFAPMPDQFSPSFKWMTK